MWTDESTEALFFNTAAAAATYYEGCHGQQDLQMVKTTGEPVQPFAINRKTVVKQKPSRRGMTPERFSGHPDSMV